MANSSVDEQLMHRCLDEVATEQEYRLLEQALINDVEVASAYAALAYDEVVISSLVARLKFDDSWLAAAQEELINEGDRSPGSEAVANPIATNQIAPKVRPFTDSWSRLLRPVVLSYANAAIVLTVVLAVLAWLRTPEGRPTVDGHRSAGNVAAPQVLATIKSISRACLVGGRSVRLSSERGLFENDRVELRGGLVELVFADGTEVLLEGPASFVIESAGKSYLERGSLVATVSSHAKDFMIKTPTTTIVDLGTRFGVKVGMAGETDVHVFDGTVKCIPLQSPQSERLLVGGESCYVKSDGVLGQISPANEDEFVAQFIDDFVAVYDFDKLQPGILAAYSERSGMAAPPEISSFLPGQDGWKSFEQVGTPITVSNRYQHHAGMSGPNAILLDGAFSDFRVSRLNDEHFSFPQIATKYFRLEFTARLAELDRVYFGLGEDVDGNGVLEAQERAFAFGHGHRMRNDRDEPVWKVLSAPGEFDTVNSTLASKIGPGGVFRLVLNVNLSANEENGAAAMLVQQLADADGNAVRSRLTPIAGLQNVNLKIREGGASRPERWNGLLVMLIPNSPWSTCSGVDNLTVIVPRRGMAFHHSEGDKQHP